MNFLRNLLKKSPDKDKIEKKVVVKSPEKKAIVEPPEKELLYVLSRMKIVEREAGKDNFVGTADEAISFLQEKKVRFLRPRSNLNYHNPQKCLSPDDKVILIDYRYQSDYGLETDYYGVVRIEQNMYFLYKGTFTDEY